ncbi:MAG: cob(I)yrinic acid a,c-diamide adenosyltransferase [Bacteriovoracia bacterium]
MKIYTRTGDKGQTSLFGGKRVSKSNGRVVVYGTFDELNSQLGLAIALCREAGDKTFAKEIDWLLQVQRDLFALGSWLASPEASKRAAKGEEAFEGARKNRTHIDETQITEMEEQIDLWEKKLEPMKSFILPGGSLVGAQVHVARTVCRRAERESIALQETGETVPMLVIQYMNRLADALFVLARHLNRLGGAKEDPWL